MSLITRATLQEARSAAGRTRGQVASFRGSPGLCGRTTDGLVGVRDDRTVTAVSGERTGECPSSGMCQNPLCDGGQIIRNFTGREGDTGIGQILMILERESRRNEGLVIAAVARLPTTPKPPVTPYG